MNVYKKSEKSVNNVFSVNSQFTWSKPKDHDLVYYGNDHGILIYEQI